MKHESMEPIRFQLEKDSEKERISLSKNYPEWEEKALQDCTLFIKDGTHGTHKNAFVFHGHLHDNYVEQYKDTLIRCCYRVESFTVKL